MGKGCRLGPSFKPSFLSNRIVLTLLLLCRSQILCDPSGKFLRLVTTITEIVAFLVLTVTAIPPIPGLSSLTSVLNQLKRPDQFIRRVLSFLSLIEPYDGAGVEKTDLMALDILILTFADALPASGLVDSLESVSEEVVWSSCSGKRMSACRKLPEGERMDACGKVSRRVPPHFPLSPQDAKLITLTIS